MKTQQDANKIVTTNLRTLKEVIAENMIKQGRVASGNTIKSMRVIETEDGGQLVGRPYFQSVQTGRRAGKVPYNFVDIIKQWAKDKKMHVQSIAYKTNKPHKYTPQERGYRQLAYFVSQKTKKQGSYLYRIGGKQDIYTEPIKQTVETVKTELGSYFKLDIENI